MPLFAVYALRLEPFFSVMRLYSALSFQNFLRVDDLNLFDKPISTCREVDD